MILAEHIVRFCIASGLIGLGGIFLCIAYVNGQTRSVLSAVSLFFFLAALLVVLPA